MPAPVTFSPEKEFVGIAPETTPGTAVAPTFTIPVEKFTAEDKPKFLDDPSLVGSMVDLFDRQVGVLIANWQLSGAMRVDTVGFLLQNIMGDRTSTGAADPYTHAYSVYNGASGQPKTHTFTHYTGLTASTGARVYAGSCLSELDLSWDAAAKLVMVSAKGMSWGSAPAAAAPTANPSSVPAMAAWRGQLGIGGPASGGTLALNAESFELNLKRKIEPYYTIGNGQQPYVIQRGALTCQGKVKFVAVDESPLVAMLANTQQQLQIVSGNGVSGAGQQQLTINMTKGSYDSAKLDEGGKGGKGGGGGSSGGGGKSGGKGGGKTAIQWAVTFDGIANSTDAGASGGLSPCKITLINANAGTVY